MIEHYQPQVLTRKREKDGAWLAPCAFKHKANASTLEEAQAALQKVVAESNGEIVATRIIFWEETEKKVINETDLI